MVFISENTKISSKRSKISTLALGLILLLTITVGVVGCRLIGNPGDQDPYGLQYRPAFHFTPDSMWMNDPNGLVYVDGEYHLFYQFYPDSNVWGPMHWGHATSNDLVHWQHKPVALFPDSLGYIFSGSAVVDSNNTSGLATDGNDVIVAIYTYHNMEGERSGRNDYQSQGIAYSNDKGITWTKYDKNPVLPNSGIKDFRDPKVSWNKETSKWIMTLAVSDHIRFYSSPDLKTWEFESEFGKSVGAHGGVWECPDLFEMNIENQPGGSKWVLLVSINPGGPNGGSATQYFTGSFDGHQFVSDTSLIRWVDYGKDNYAGVTFSNIPKIDGRVISISWMSNWQYAQVVPTFRWRSAMTFPRQFTLEQSGQLVNLKSTPIDEIQLLREEKKEIEPAMIDETKAIYNPVSGPCEIIATFKLPANSTATEFGIKLSNKKGEQVKSGYDLKNRRYFIDRKLSGKTEFSADFPGVHFAPYVTTDTTFNIRLLVDVASVEMFADDGRVVMTDIFFPNEKFMSTSFYSVGGKIELERCVVYKLNSAFK